MVLDDLGFYLQAQGVGTVDQTIFLGQVPETPDDVIVLLEYGGAPPMHTHDNPQRAIEYPRVQVTARSKSYQTARQNCEAALSALDRIVNTSINGTRYLRCLAQQAPFLLGKDQNARHQVVVNCELWKAVTGA